MPMMMESTERSGYEWTVKRSSMARMRCRNRLFLSIHG